MYPTEYKILNILYVCNKFVSPEGITSNYVSILFQIDKRNNIPNSFIDLFF